MKLGKWKARGRIPTKQGSGSKHLVAPLLGLVLSCFAGCDVNSYEAKEHCPASCAGDACSEGIACSSDARCPIGSSCQFYQDREAACGATDFPEVPANVLLEEFEVSEFPLTRDPAKESEFVFDPPPGAKVVVCGLFIAKPRFEKIGDDVPLPANTAVRRMINADSCIARERTFHIDDADESTGPTVLRLTELRSKRNDCGGNNGAPFGDGSRYPTVETLHLGCWALDSNNVMGASILIPVSPGDLQALPQIITDCDQGDVATDGAYCTIKDLEGACIDGKCVPGADSLDAGSDAMDAGADGGVTTRVRNCGPQPDGTLCRTSPPHRVGRCFEKGCVDQNVLTLERPLVIANCALQGADTDWLNCFPSALGTIGTCFEQTCRVRCHELDDCKRTEKSRRVEDAVEECRFSDPPSYLGVCRTVEAPQ